jgi:hypothetical protein
VPVDLALDLPIVKHGEVGFVLLQQLLQRWIHSSAGLTADFWLVRLNPSCGGLLMEEVASQPIMGTFPLPAARPLARSVARLAPGAAPRTALQIKIT